MGQTSKFNVDTSKSMHLTTIIFTTLGYKVHLHCNYKKVIFSFSYSVLVKELCLTGKALFSLDPFKTQ